MHIYAHNQARSASWSPSRINLVILVAIHVAIFKPTYCIAQPHPKEFLGQRALPPDVENAVKSEPKLGDVYAVSNERPFGGQILKTEILTFQPNAKLYITNTSYPWIAIVAKTIQFVDSSSANKISVNSGWTPAVRHPPSAKPGMAKKPKPGSDCAKTSIDGLPGDDGLLGNAGEEGEAGAVIPKVYLITNNLVDKLGRPIPQLLNLSFDVHGNKGGDGGEGGKGGDGGEGGDGADGNWDSAFPTPHCYCPAKSGGPGGIGGPGGPGGKGGKGGDGGELVWIGPDAVIASLSYSPVENSPGRPGRGGLSGRPGYSARGGDRGAHPGWCGGGDPGSYRTTPQPPLVRNADGNDGQRGVINFKSDDNIGRLF
jgi:hypothetical protein